LIDAAGEQAQLGSGAPRIVQLAAADPLHTAIMADLPRERSSVSIAFRTGQSALDPEQITQLTQWALSDGEAGPRPGSEIVVRAYADAFGSEEENLALSQERARAVAAQLRAAGLDIEKGAAQGMGEYAAQADTGDEVRSPKWRRVDVIIR
jgi:outer membrane protein OmpA-like peptidoglycan-associated protein